MDPYYRTLKGFRVLVEKEWLALGHKFQHRSNLTGQDRKDANFAPMFLQFLDVVHQVITQFCPNKTLQRYCNCLHLHLSTYLLPRIIYSSIFFHQIHNQFPSAFEFNQFYLRYLAYHHVSCRFNTFTFDNERLRLSSGYNYESAQTSERGSGMTGLETRTPAGQDNSDDEGSTAVSSAALGKCFTTGCVGLVIKLRLKHRVQLKIVSGSSDEAGSGGTDVFDYIELAHAKSPLFFNFDFAPNQYSVLRPFSKLIDLDVWNYYYTEELNMGPIGKLPFYNRLHNLIETFLLMTCFQVSTTYFLLNPQSVNS